MSVTITIPYEEFEEAWNIVHLIKPGETRALGQVRLQCDGTQRRWSASDSIRGAQIIGGSDPDTYSIGIPPLLFTGAHLATDAAGDITFIFDEAKNTLLLEGNGTRFSLPTQHSSFPDVDGRMLVGESVGAQGTVPVQSLLDLMKTAMTLREVHEEVVDVNGPVFPAPFWVYVDDGKVGVVADWQTVGESRFQIEGTNSNGSRYVMVNPHYFLSILRVFELDDEVTLKIPVTTDLPVAVVGVSRSALLMPLQTRMYSARRHVEHVLTEEFGYLSAIMNDDDNYLISRHGSEIFGRLFADDDVPVFRVFAKLLDECEPTEELLRELNELNAGMTFARLHLHDGLITAEADVFAEQMTPSELNTVAGRVWSIARNIIPTLAAVLGGRQFTDPMVHRLDKYRTTRVEAEVFPGTSLFLNGPEAISEWPFPGPVHVVTAWYPEGVHLSEHEAADINRQIANDILSLDGRFVLATGHPSDNDLPEPSLVVWGIERDEALDIARAAHRDAILEIDADEVRLVMTRGDVTESWKRR